MAAAGGTEGSTWPIQSCYRCQSIRQQLHGRAGGGSYTADGPLLASGPWCMLSLCWGLPGHVPLPISCPARAHGPSSSPGSGVGALLRSLLPVPRPPPGAQRCPGTAVG